MDSCLFSVLQCPPIQLHPEPWSRHRKSLDGRLSKCCAHPQTLPRDILQLELPTCWSIIYFVSARDQLTSRYPPAHPETIIPIATPTLRLPNTLPTTVGIVLKNPPFAAPFMITKTINGPRVSDTGHSTNILRALIKSEMKSVLTGPMKSARNPQRRRPTADEKLKPATRPAPADGDSPSEFE